MLGLDMRKRSRVFTVCPARSGTRVGSEIYLCQVIDNGKGLSFPTSRVGDIRGIVEPVRVVDVEITKNNYFRAWRL